MPIGFRVWGKGLPIRTTSPCLHLPQHQARIRKFSLSPDSGLPITASCWQNLTGRSLSREPETCLIPGPNRKQQSTEGWVGDHKSVTSVRLLLSLILSSLLTGVHSRGQGQGSGKEGALGGRLLSLASRKISRKNLELRK